jgi:hypothetical protein
MKHLTVWRRRAYGILENEQIGDRPMRLVRSPNGFMRWCGSGAAWKRCRLAATSPPGN